MLSEELQLSHQVQRVDCGLVMLAVHLLFELLRLAQVIYCLVKLTHVPLALAQIIYCIGYTDTTLP